MYRFWAILFALAAILPGWAAFRRAQMAPTTVDVLRRSMSASDDIRLAGVRALQQEFDLGGVQVSVTFKDAKITIAPFGSTWEWVRNALWARTLRDQLEQGCVEVTSTWTSSGGRLDKLDLQSHPTTAAQIAREITNEDYAGGHVRLHLLVEVNEKRLRLVIAQLQDTNLTVRLPDGRAYAKMPLPVRAYLMPLRTEAEGQAAAAVLRSYGRGHPLTTAVSMPAGERATFAVANQLGFVGLGGLLLVLLGLSLHFWLMHLAWAHAVVVIHRRSPPDGRPTYARLLLRPWWRRRTIDELLGGSRAVLARQASSAPSLVVHRVLAARPAAALAPALLVASMWLLWLGDKNPATRHSPTSALTRLETCMGAEGGGVNFYASNGVWAARLPASALSSLFPGMHAPKDWAPLATGYTRFDFDADGTRLERRPTSTAEILSRAGADLAVSPSLDTEWRGLLYTRIADPPLLVVTQPDRAALTAWLDGPDGPRTGKHMGAATGIPASVFGGSRGYVMPLRDEAEQRFADRVIDLAYWTTVDASTAVAPNDWEDPERFVGRVAAVVPASIGARGVAVFLLAALVASFYLWRRYIRAVRALRRHYEADRAAPSWASLAILPAPELNALLAMLEKRRLEATERFAAEERRERLERRKQAESAAPELAPEPEPPDPEELRAEAVTLEALSNAPTVPGAVRTRAQEEIRKALGQRSLIRAQRILEHARYLLSNPSE